MTPEGARNRSVVFLGWTNQLIQVAHFRTQLLLICLMLLAGCKCQPCRVSCCSPCWPCVRATENRGGLLLLSTGNDSSVTPPPDADLPPAGFPDSFTASVGSPYAKFFPLPTRPVFHLTATGGQAVENATEGSAPNSSPASPEVIPTPPPLPPDEFGGQPGPVTPPIWMYEPGRWRSTTTSGKTGEDDRTSPNGPDVSYAPNHQISWLFQSPSLTGVASPQTEPPVVLPGQISTVTSGRQTPRLRR